MSMIMTHALKATPIGTILVVGDAHHIHAIRIGEGADIVTDDVPRADMPAAVALEQLQAYLDGRLDLFDLPLTPAATLRGAALRDSITAIPAGDTELRSACANRRIEREGDRAGLRPQSLSYRRPLSPGTGHGRRSRSLFGRRRSRYQKVDARA